jgi:hypothetical protein
MIVHNPNKLPTIDYRKAEALQGNLKDLNDLNYEKLKKVLENRGFTTPLFIWFMEETPYLIDGHQRQRVMVKEDMNDDGSYEVPYLEIEASSIADAKAQLLEISSQYGTITQEGFDEFIAIDEMPEAEIVEVVSFDRLPQLSAAANDKPKKLQLLTCPECQFEGQMKDYKIRYEDRLGFQDHEPEPA